MTDENKKRVLDILAEDAGEGAATDSTFEMLGLDSLEYLNAIVRIEATFDVAIPEGAVAEFDTPGDVIAWIEADKCA